MLEPEYVALVTSFGALIVSLVTAYLTHSPKVVIAVRTQTHNEDNSLILTVKHVRGTHAKNVRIRFSGSYKGRDQVSQYDAKFPLLLSGQELKLGYITCHNGILQCCTSKSSGFEEIEELRVWLQYGKWFRWWPIKWWPRFPFVLNPSFANHVDLIMVGGPDPIVTVSKELMRIAKVVETTCLTDSKRQRTRKTTD